METDLLTRMKVHLEAGRFLRDFSLTEAEEKLIASYPLLTRKAVIIILNVGEEGLAEQDLIDKLQEDFREHDFQWIAVSAKIEQELCQLEAAERQTFLEELQLDQPALDRLTDALLQDPRPHLILHRWAGRGTGLDKPAGIPCPSSRRCHSF